MGRLGYWLSRAARQIARDPRVREKVSEIYAQKVKPAATEIYHQEVKPRAAKLYEGELKPRAKDAWQKGKPKFDAAKKDLRDIARQTNPRQDPKGFAKKVKEHFFDGLGDSGKKSP